MMKARLEQRLETGEPKCANCRSWKQGKEPTSNFGVCQKLVAVIADKDELAKNLAVLAATTTDLTVCSAWEQKE